MFGYVRLRPDTIPREERVEYEAIYCGLCHTMGRRYGAVSRLFLNYDFAFLAMLLAPGEEKKENTCCRCAAHPVKGRPVCAGGTWLETAAAESVILTYWKLQDTAADGGFWERLEARILLLLLRRSYRRAQREYPTFDSQTAQRLKELRELERSACSSIDRTADCFAGILRAAAPETGRSPQDRAAGELLYQLGRWIYLIDGVDDLDQDRKAGNYNPIAVRFPAWTAEDKEYLRNMLDRSVERMGAAFQLLDPNPWTPVLENIIYSGLPNVEELVFSGRWREHQTRHRRMTDE